MCHNWMLWLKTLERNVQASSPSWGKNSVHSKGIQTRDRGQPWPRGPWANPIPGVCGHGRKSLLTQLSWHFKSSLEDDQHWQRASRNPLNGEGWSKISSRWDRVISPCLLTRSCQTSSGTRKQTGAKKASEVHESRTWEMWDRVPSLSQSVSSRWLQWLCFLSPLSQDSSLNALPMFFSPPKTVILLFNRNLLFLRAQ